MENLTMVGMKELNQRLAKIERHLDDIAKALNQIAKVQNRKVPFDSKSEDNDNEVQ